MPDELGPAVSALQRKLEEQLQGVADTKRTINMLLKMSGQAPLYPESENETSGSVRPDQFYGKGLTQAAAEYLAIRKQACQPDDILRALKMGGFDFDLQGWREDDRLRSFTIALARNTGGGGKFHRLKNGSFGLRSWYDEEFLKKAKAGADATAKAKKKKANSKSVKAKTSVVKVKAASKPHIIPRPETETPKSSAKEKSRPAADQTAQKEA